MEKSEKQSKNDTSHEPSVHDFVAEAARLAVACGGASGVHGSSVRLDHAREQRCGFPEFIYGAGKSFEQLSTIVGAMLEREGCVFVTRLDAERGEKLRAMFPGCEYDEAARTFGRYPQVREQGEVAVISAGSSDYPVAAEAMNTLRACGWRARAVNDVGVAGIERLFAAFDDRLRSADACIVAAGMEGALPSVIGGLLKCPLIAVPTSVGYGSALNGFTALLGMLSSCASGITVVNIDNGFGAACAAARILRSKYEK